jgi:hypothetical protein
MLNWRRGIFRLWAVISVLWVVVTIGIAYQQHWRGSADFWEADPVVLHLYEAEIPDGRRFLVQAPSELQAAQALDAYVQKNHLSGPPDSIRTFPTGFAAFIPYQPSAPTPSAIGFWVTTAFSLPIAGGIVLLLFGWAIGGFSAKKAT